MYEYENNYLSFPLIVPGRLQSSMQTTMCMAMTMTSTKDGVETCMEQQESPLSKSSNSQSEQHYPTFTRGKLFFPQK